MATKQLGKYEEFRTTARSLRPARVSGAALSSNDDPLMLTVEGGPDQETILLEAARLRLANVIVPEWQRKIKPLELTLDRILLEMGELTKLHGKKLHNLSFQTSNDDAVISNQVKKITKMMRDVKEGIKGLGVGVDMSPQVTYMKENIQKVLASRLQDVGNQFRRNQLSYQSELEATTAPKKNGSGTSGSSSSLGGSADRPVQLDDSDGEEEGNVTSYDIGFNEQQQARVETSRIRINQRMQEIRDIAQQVEELGQMFNDIAVMIHEQGSLLDRIDYNIESADHSITEGKKNLEEVVKGEKGFSKRLCFLMLLILIFGIVVIIVVLTKPR